jgi:hypothetical protein
VKTWAAVTALLVIVSCVLLERCAARPHVEGRRARETHRRLPPRPASVARVAR